MYYLNLIKSNIKIIGVVFILSVIGFYTYKYKHNISQISILQDLLKDSKTNNIILNDSINKQDDVNRLNDKLDNKLSNNIERINSKVENSKLTINKNTTSEDNINIIYDVYKEVK